MNKYLLTGEKFEGSITYGYNSAGYLCFFSVDALLSDEQFKGFLTSIENVLKEAWFLNWAAHYKYRVTQLQDDLSFARAWDEYNMKRDRKEAEKIWDKLSTTEKQLFFQSLKGYKRYMQRNPWYQQQYLKTYLAQRQWTSEWDKIN